MASHSYFPKWVVKKIIWGALLLPTLCYAWNSAGHRLVAQIAYDQLTPAIRHKVNVLTHKFDTQYQQVNFVNSAPWADQLRQQGIDDYDSWHFIDLPYLDDGEKAAPMEPHNLVWAIAYCIHILKDPHTSDREKAFSLRMLVHLVGDIEQPLHCINHINQQFPHGDYGGNLVMITVNHQAMSLHRFWDSGAGYFEKISWHQHLPWWQLQKDARRLEARYPLATFKQQLEDHTISDWARESYRLAKLDAYAIPPNTTPTPAYIQNAQAITAQQVTLAGYRLAQLLQDIFVDDAWINSGKSLRYPS